MEFTLKFVTEDETQILDKIGSPGIDVLDDIRKEKEEYKSLKADQIFFRDYCVSDDYILDIKISEEKARESQRFNGKVLVIVEVGGFGCLSRYQKFKISEHFEKNIVFDYFFFKKEEKYIDYIEAKYVIDYESLYNDWKAAGFPLKWKI